MGLSGWKVLAMMSKGREMANELAKRQRGSDNRSFAAVPPNSVIWVVGGMTLIQLGNECLEPKGGRKA